MTVRITFLVCATLLIIGCQHDKDPEGWDENASSNNGRFLAPDNSNTNVCETRINTYNGVLNAGCAYNGSNLVCLYFFNGSMSVNQYPNDIPQPCVDACDEACAPLVGDRSSRIDSSPDQRSCRAASCADGFCQYVRNDVATQGRYPNDIPAECIDACRDACEVIPSPPSSNDGDNSDSDGNASNNNDNVMVNLCQTDRMVTGTFGGGKCCLSNGESKTSNDVCIAGKREARGAIGVSLNFGPQCSILCDVGRDCERKARSIGQTSLIDGRGDEVCCLNTTRGSRRGIGVCTYCETDSRATLTGIVSCGGG